MKINLELDTLVIQSTAQCAKNSGIMNFWISARLENFFTPPASSRPLHMKTFQNQFDFRL